VDNSGLSGLVFVIGVMPGCSSFVLIGVVRVLLILF